LTERLGEKVDLDEVSLDHARFADADMEEALVEYLQKRQAKWKPDLVVPIGSPAGKFVEQYRDRLFPQTPILYTGMDRRRLRADALQNNAAFVGESFDGPGFIEDILQLAPDTTNIVCVIGASPVERYWAAAFQSDFARFTNRVGFTWLNDLPFDQMLERVRRLPSHSFIFMILLMRDAAGVTHEADRALRRIREVANAPVNSIYQEQLGLGIVGGRLYRAEFEGVEGARMAIRILRGEAASSFPPMIVGPIGSQYDWRELRRWHISEDRLPAGSVVKYRGLTVWERHRGFITTTVSVALMQGVWILGLLVNLRRRRRAERLLAESEKAARELSGRLITAQEDERRRIARDLHDDFNQRLALLSIEADLLERMEDKPEAKELSRNISNGTKELSLEIHKLSHELHPASLDQLGLVTATDSFCQELTKQSGVPIKFTHDAIPRDLDRDVSLCLYRLVQEALQNTLKHSHAAQARVDLHRHNGELKLVISDNGCGFNPQTVSQHEGLGLVGMRERVRLVHGRIDFYSAPDEGTRIEVNVPVVLTEK
jgi:signal transduction histidine kinase